MKIKCERCGTTIDTDKETKCSNCGTFYDRNIFREHQIGIKEDKKCSNPLHDNCEMNEYLQNKDNAQKKIEYKNGKRIETYSYTLKNGRKNVSIVREYPNKNSNIDSKKYLSGDDLRKHKGFRIFTYLFIFTPIILPIIIIMFSVLSMLLNVNSSGDIEKTMDDLYIGNTGNTGIVEVINEDNSFEYTTGPLHLEVRSSVDDKYYVALKSYQEIFSPKFDNKNFRYYRFNFEIQNLTDEEIYSSIFSAKSDEIDCSRVYLKESVSGVKRIYKMETDTVYLEDVVIEVPKENVNLEIMYGNNVYFKFNNFQY